MAAVAVAQQQQVVVARQLLLLMKMMRLRTCAQSAWTTRTMQLWMSIMLGCVVRVGSLAAALAKLEGLLPDHPTAKPAVRPINCLG